MIIEELIAQLHRYPLHFKAAGCRADQGEGDIVFKLIGKAEIMSWQRTVYLHLENDDDNHHCEHVSVEELINLLRWVNAAQYTVQGLMKLRKTHDLILPLTGELEFHHTHKFVYLMTDAPFSAAKLAPKDARLIGVKGVFARIKTTGFEFESASYPATHRALPTV